MAKAQPNKVELIGTYGGDVSHACSAWTSTSRDLDKENKKGVKKRDRIEPLLKMLAENHHGTPFEKSTIHFLCTTDIATHIHLLKHRIGVSINAESARYKELKGDNYYVPSDWDTQTQEDYIAFMETAYAGYHKCLDSVEASLVAQGIPKSAARKRAKESARFYLPYGNQLVCDVQFNFRSFYHFLKLRYAMDAQKEIRDLASQMLQQVHAQGDFNKTLIAFGLLDTETNVLRGPFEKH